MNRTFLVSLVLLATLSSTACAGEKLLLTRTLVFDFNRPGHITQQDATGAKPVSEKIDGQVYEMVLPKAVKLRLGMRDANKKKEDFYRIGLKLTDEDRPAEKREGVITPDRVRTNWVFGPYRYLFTLLASDAEMGDFHKVTLKMEVYGPAD